MTSLKEEEPFAFVVKNAFIDSTCSFCFTSGETVHKCKGCHVLSYCNEKCQKSDWVNHKNECRILNKEMASAERTPGDHNRLTLRILLKSEKALALKAFNGRTWDSLEARGEMRPPFFSGADYIFALLKPVKHVSHKEVFKALRKVITNGMEIIESILGVRVIGFGVYLGLSIHKHSCLPDSQLIFTGKKASLRALDDTAEYSPNLTISYTDHPPWTPDRKNLFKESLYFDCTCPLCTDENHIMNRMGSSCYVSCCEDAAGVLDENSSGPYRCNKCGKASAITVSAVRKAEEKIDLHRQVMAIGTAFHLDTHIATNKAMELLLINEKILSIYNFQYIGLCMLVRSMAIINDLPGMRRFVQDKELKAVEYYLHEKDRRRVAFLMIRTFLKYALIDADDFDESQAVNAVERTFGRDHPVAVKFKEHNEEYRKFSSTEQAEVSSFLREFGILDPLFKFFL